MRSHVRQKMCISLLEDCTKPSCLPRVLCITMFAALNQPFGEWGKIFPDAAMTLAAVDRLVHHATIFEMNVESYRRRAALERKHGAGRPAHYATPKNTGVAPPPENPHRGATPEEPVAAQEDRQ